MSFKFMSEKIIRENFGETGVDRLFTAADSIPAFSYIQELFEEARTQE